MHTNSKKKSFFICVSIICFFITACATVPITGRRQLLFVSPSELLSLSETQYSEILLKETISTDLAKQDLVKKIGIRIAQATEVFLRETGKTSEIENYAWEFKVLENDKNINAFCLPGGKIVVYTGIMNVAQTEEELAVVISHEVAHAIANHGGERLSQEIVYQLGENTLSKALKNQPTKTRSIVLSALGLGTQVGILLPYNRTHETEADRIGLYLMKRAGYNPQAAVHFWERMENMEQSQSLEFLSTHPSSSKRITDINNEILILQNSRKEQ
jgi:predicted Zn-dependent protease